jgi:hypothetical protein
VRLLAKCAHCGNTPRLGEPLCGRCEGIEAANREHDAAFDRLDASIGDILPDDGPARRFAEAVRDVLYVLKHP